MDKPAGEMPHSPQKAAFLMSAFYVIVGCVYIVLSDLLVQQPYVPIQLQAFFQTGKGLLYVLISGLGLYLTLIIYIKKLNRLMREQLQAVEALRVALDKFPGPSIIFDQDRRVSYVNVFALTILGANRDEMMGRLSSAVFPAETSDTFAALLEKAFETGEPTSGEISLKVGKRRTYYVITNVPTHKDDGSVDKVITLANDVSDRKYSAIRMDQQRKELRQIIDLIPNFVFAKDGEGRYVMANEAFARFHGLSVEQIMGRTLAEVLPDRTAVREISEQDIEVLKRGVTIYRPCQRMKDSTGRECFFQVTKIPFRLATSNQPAVLGVAIDITDRLKNEAAINKIQERFRAMVDHSLDALFVYGADGNLTLVNKRASELLGQPIHELIGTSFMKALMGDRPVTDPSTVPILYPGSNFQLVLQRSGGAEIPVEIRVGPLPGDEEGGMFLAEVRDITERLQLERERQLMSKLGLSLSATKEPSEVAHAIFDTLRQYVPLDSFYFASRISGKSRFRARLIVDRMHGELQYFPGYDYELRSTSPILDVYEGRNRLILRDDAESDRSKFTPIGNTGLKSRSLMFLPISIGGKVIGVMSIQSYQANIYGLDTLDMVQRMADMAAPALESAQLNQQKSMFAELGRQLGAARTADDVAEVVAQLADDLTGWDSCIIGLYSREDDNISYAYIADEVNGQRQRIYEQNFFRRPRLLAERVLKEGPFLILRERFNPADTHVPRGRNARPALSMIWVPIPGEQGPTGFISLQSYAYQAYDEDDLQTVRALADHCGAALNRTGSQELLRYREERYRLAIESTGAAAYQLDYVHHEYIFMGNQIEQITGYTADEFSTELWREITLELFIDPASEVSKDAEGRKVFKEWKAEMRIRRRDGEERWISDQAVQLHNQAGVAIGTLGILRDITEQKRVELALRASEERYALSARGANDGLWDWDLKTHRIHFSERFSQMLGLPHDEMFNTPEQWYEQIHPDDLHQMKQLLDAHLEGSSRHFECEVRTRHRNGTYRWMLVRGIAVRDEFGAPTRIAGSQTDITDRVLTQERLLHDALHDPLTGLPNRTLLMEHLDRSLEQMRRRAGFRFAVVFMDLDRFKMINDSLGHLVGDHVLVTVAHRLKNAVRPLDVVARFAGDEFALVLQGLESDGEIVEIVSRVQAVVAEPITVDHHDIITTTSAGVAVGATSYSNPSDLLRDADNALYKAKGEGPGRFKIFDTSMHEHAVRMLKLEADLRRAEEKGQFRVHYQPIINVESGAVERFEALVRWQHPDHGLLMPDQFMPVAEETGLIFDVDEWVIAESCRCWKRWNEEINGDNGQELPVKINVNLSPRHFLRRINLADRLSEIVAREGVSPKLVGIELTENALLSLHDETYRALVELKERGFSIYLDDFGKGYSSLSYLHNFPFDVVKIDRLFMLRIQEEGPEREIVHAILSLAHKLNLGVVAEGIETANQMQIVRQLDCKFAQGFYISPGVEPDVAIQMVMQAKTW